MGEEVRGAGGHPIPAGGAGRVLGLRAKDR